MATINGTAGTDTLSGTSGNDTLFGLDGNDTLDGGAGDDVLDGGSGLDRAFFFNSSSGDVVVNLATGTASGPETGHDTLVNIESAYGSGGGNVTVIGDGGDNFLSASAGKVVSVSAGGGNDFVVANPAPGSVLDGGSGQNLLNLSFTYRPTGTFNTVAAPRTTPVQLTFTPGISGNVEGIAYANFQYLSLTTGAGNDAVTFNMPQNSIASSLVGVFSDYWDGGDGTDTATVDLSGYSNPFILTAPVTGQAGSPTSIIALPVGATGTSLISFLNVENYHLVGGSADDTFRTGNGNDILTGGGGNDALDGGQGTDIARYSGVYSDYRIDQLATSAFRVTDLRPGSPDGTDSLSNIDILQWGDGSRTNLYNTAPILEGLPVVALPGQTLVASSLFSVTDYDGNAITQYQLWDATRDAASGHFVINGVAQAAGTVLNVSAAQLSQVSFVTGTIGDNLQIRAFDGNRWSAQDSDSWSPFSITINHAPILATADYRVGANWSLPFPTLAAAADIDNDLIREYQLWDGTRDPNSGHFVVNGVAQAAGTLIEVYSTQLSQVSFVTGTVGDNLQIRAFDGIQWSAADNATWAPFSIIIDRAPVLTTGNLNLAAGQSRPLSSLISVSDPEGDAITKYQLWDGTSDPNSGHFVINGASQSARTLIEITAAQLGQTSFVAGTANDVLQVRAFDGTAWSAADNAVWAPFSIGPSVNRPPVVTTGPLSQRPGQSIAFSSLASITDADGDTIQKYQLWDANRDPNSGHFVVNGAPQPAGAIIEITAVQATQTSFLVGTVGDTLQIRAFDGKEWSAADNASWAPFTITPPANHAPTVTTTDQSSTHGQTWALSSLFSQSDADGDAMTRYQLWDGTSDPASGHFVVDGAVQPSGKVIDITASQFSQTSFVTGAVGDRLQIRAFDGSAWSAADDASWSPFSILVPAYTTPVVITTNAVLSVNQSVALSSLFSVSDADGDPAVAYELWDSTVDPASGHFTVNGVVRPAGTVIHISAAQLGQTSFVAGRVGDSLQIRAFDGISWSAADNAVWAPFAISISAIVGTPGNDYNLVGTPGDDVIYGLAGDDSFWDTAGNDILDGGDGHDTLRYDNAVSGVTVDLSITGPQATGGSGTEQILNIEGIIGSTFADTLVGGGNSDLLLGSYGNDVLQGGGGPDFLGGGWDDDFLYGGAGDDYLEGDGGNDFLDGGAGTDDIANFDGSVNVNLVTGIATGTEGTDTLVSIEGVNINHGSGSNIVGDDHDNSFSIHNGGTSTIVAGGGNDFVEEDVGIGSFLDGGDGIDWLILDRSALTASTTVTFTPGSSTLQGLPDGTQFRNFENIWLTTGSGDDTIVFNGLISRTSNSFSAGAGNDLAVVDLSTKDTAVTVLAYSGGNFTFAADDFAVLGLWSVETVNITGGTAADALVGGDGNDMLAGGGGDDQLNGGGGIDVARYSGPATSYQTVLLSGMSARITDMRPGSPDGTDTLANIEKVQWGDGSTTTLFGSAPILTTQNMNATAAQTMALSNLFSVSDPDGDAIVAYELWDSTGDPASGHFTVNGVAKAAGTVIDITAAELGQTAFVTGSVGDTLQIRAFDGISWSAADTAPWAGFHISV